MQFYPLILTQRAENPCSGNFFFFNITNVTIGLTILAINSSGFFLCIL